MAKSGIGSEAADVLGAVIVLAMITVFVRPGSQGPSLVQNFLSGFTSLVGVASGSSFASTSSPNKG